MKPKKRQHNSIRAFFFSKTNFATTLSEYLTSITYYFYYLILKGWFSHLNTIGMYLLFGMVLLCLF